MKLVYITIAFINTLGFVLIGLDKLKAKNKEWRIAERNFFLLALVGGAPGVFLGMQVFRHKTKHYTFMLGIPALFVVDILLAYLIISR